MRFFVFAFFPELSEHLCFGLSLPSFIFKQSYHICTLISWDPPGCFFFCFFFFFSSSSFFFFKMKADVETKVVEVLHTGVDEDVMFEKLKKWADASGKELKKWGDDE